jgi:hypothetical protein
LGVFFENVLPVLRTPALARAAPALLHIPAPGEQDKDTPVVAFTSDAAMVTRAHLAASKLSEQELYRKAMANLAKRRASWRVEQLASGGLGKKSAQAMSLVDDFAAEHILIEGFLDEVERMMPNATFFVPRRGTLRCVVPALVEKERSKARRVFRTARGEAVCPVELHRSPIIGQLFALGAHYCEQDYATPAPSPVQK